MRAASAAARPAAPACPCAARRTGRRSRSCRRPAGSRAVGSAVAKNCTSTPLGMITASPPRCSTCTCRASSLTAIRPVIFSMNGCSMPWNALQPPRTRVGGVEGGDDRAVGDRSARAWTGSAPPARARAARRTCRPGSTSDPGCRTPGRTTAGRPSRCTGSAMLRPAGHHELRELGGTVAVVARREHGDVVTRGRSASWAQVGDVRLHPAGDVEGVRADQADPHPAAPADRRPRSRAARRSCGRQVRPPQRLQHVPVGRVLRRCPARRCRPPAGCRRGPARRSRVPGSVIGGWICSPSRRR